MYMSSYHVPVINLVSRLLPHAVDYFKSVSHQLQQKLPEGGAREGFGAVYNPWGVRVSSSLFQSPALSLSFLESYLKMAVRKHI